LECFFFFFAFFEKRLDLKRVLGFSKTFFKNKAAFCLFFSSGGFVFKFFSSLIVPSSEQDALVLDKFINIDFLFLKIFFDLNSLYFVLVNKFEFGFYDRLVCLCFFFLKKKMATVYNNLIFSSFNSSSKTQLKNLEPNTKILGFKLHISGRLSRKDRASDIWFSYGSVPANKFSANIDYAFYTVPLINSIVRVKVWINRGVTDVW
jgi:hypothetical protein